MSVPSGRFIAWNSWVVDEIRQNYCMSIATGAYDDVRRQQEENRKTLDTKYILLDLFYYYSNGNTMFHLSILTQLRFIIIIIVSQCFSLTKDKPFSTYFPQLPVFLNVTSGRHQINWLHHLLWSDPRGLLCPRYSILWLWFSMWCHISPRVLYTSDW